MMDINKYIEDHKDQIESSIVRSEDLLAKSETEDNNTPTEAAADDVKEEEKDIAEPVENSDTEVEKPNETEVKEEVKKDEHKPNKQKYSKQEQMNYAFAKEKAKRKKLEARIAELEEENKKFKDLNVEDFKNDQQKYTDYLVDRKMNEMEKSRLQAEYESSRSEEAEKINQYRINQCFEAQEDRDAYNSLIQKNGKQFLAYLDKNDPQQAVLGYLDDCDVSPIIIRLMMTRQDIRDSIMSKSTPYAKTVALDKLADRIVYAQNVIKQKAAKANAEPAKPNLPVIGKVTKSETTNTDIDLSDPNAILKKLNQKRKYH